VGSTHISDKATKAIDEAYNAGDLIYVASITLVEVIYLVEKSKLPVVALERLKSILKNTDSGFEIVTLDFNIVLIMSEISRSVIPDMPDRIIAAIALYLGLPLVTCDTKIQSADIETIW
jgi:predicted nucleic acid-binding protein